ncbi:MAG TPA: MFS transporter [Bacteroidetes bacterium]|nr:MFS transporter [Bacteroidota bacterium]
MSNTTHKIFNIAVIVAALGYFVDIYDLILYILVRNPSLKDIGVPAEQMKQIGIHLFNYQMVGMLCGGIVWGILGDKKGRMTALFLTILIYSLANIANGFVQTVEQYQWLRFIAGFGLAGELGLGITLVTETMSKETRGYGTMIVAGVGLCGTVLAYLISEWGWRETYWLGGILGLMLLVLRIYIHESGMYHSVKEQNVSRGNFLGVFTKGKQAYKFFLCILVGLPVWFVIGILISYASEFATYMNVQGTIAPSKAVLIHYVGAAIGSIVTGMLGQILHSRKKSLNISLITLLLFTVGYFYCFNASASVFYLFIFLMGISQGYWGVFVTVASEQFGTNIRSTITTTVPNFVRGAAAIMTTMWQSMSASSNIMQSAIIIGGVVILLSFLATYLIEETFGKELNYVE